MEFKEEDIKLEVEEEILLDQVVEVVPCPGKRIPVPVTISIATQQVPVPCCSNGWSKML